MAKFYDRDDDLHYFGDEPSPELIRQRRGRIATVLGAIVATVALSLFPTDTQRNAVFIDAANHCTGQDLANVRPGTPVDVYAAKLQKDGVGGEIGDIEQQLTATNPASIIVINEIPVFTGEQIFIPESCELTTNLGIATQQN